MQYDVNVAAAQVLEDALFLYWLRPENALALASYVIHGKDLAPKQNLKYADIACGDGINTFFKCGGRFAKSFDLFLAGISDAKARLIADQNIDVYDVYDDSYAPIVINRPKYDYFLGTDHKTSLLKKAEHLKYYSNLLVKDLREDLPEVDDASLDLIYCNSLYWVKETGVALQSMKKKLGPGGVIILDVFTTNKKKLDWGKLYENTPESWQALLNRGRQQTNPGLRDEKGWESLFKANNMYVAETQDILPASLAHIWNLGLRPLFPVLNKIASYCTPENRMEIKEEWVEIFKELLLPVLEDPGIFSKDETVYRLQYTLKPNSQA